MIVPSFDKVLAKAAEESLPVPKLQSVTTH